MRLALSFVALITAACALLAGSLWFASAHPGDCQPFATDWAQAQGCDNDSNGVINSNDLGIVASNFGMRAPTATMTPHTPPSDTPSPPSPTATAASCTAPTALPVGAIPGQPPPVFCGLLGTQIDTSVRGPNTWLDDFEHGQSFAHISPAYKTYALTYGGGCRAVWWAHNQHFMTDRISAGCRGVMMRPDQSFRFENGKLVVVADVAAGYEPYGGATWPELVIATSPAPTTNLQNGLYAYSHFQGFYAAGCRLGPNRRPTCAMYPPSAGGEGPSGGRLMEISFFQKEGAVGDVGGGEWRGGYRLCNFGDPDTNCRDRFRWEITKDTWTLHVNGVAYMEHRQMQPSAQVPDAFLDSDIYVYFAEWGTHEAETTRFHWDHLCIGEAC